MGAKPSLNFYQSKVDLSSNHYRFTVYLWAEFEEKLRKLFNNFMNLAQLDWTAPKLSEKVAQFNQTAPKLELDYGIKKLTFYLFRRGAGANDDCEIKRLTFTIYTQISISTRL